MGVRKKVAQEKLYDIERFHKTTAVRPLFGQERLVRIQRRKQNGVLLCNSIMSIADSFTFSNSNERTEPFGAQYIAAAPAFLGEPRLNFVNELAEEEMRRFHDYGRELPIMFRPEKGKTYALECDIYRPVEINYGGTLFPLLEPARFAQYMLTLDLSAYAQRGYRIDPPRCELELPTTDHDGNPVRSRMRRLAAQKRADGVWEWRVHDLTSGTGGNVRLSWLIFDREPHSAATLVNLDKLSTELSVDPRVAKDLHNFVSICHYLAADFRSMHEIERNMIVTRSALSRSLESIEQLVGAELIERTKGKGLIRLTPAGEAVLEWWSRFYMRWTPIVAKPRQPK